MASDRLIVHTPAELALPYAENLSEIWHGDPHPRDFVEYVEEQTLTQLEMAAMRLQMLNSTYFTRTDLAYVMTGPQLFEVRSEIDVVASFCASAIVKNGILPPKAGSVQDLCLALNGIDTDHPEVLDLMVDDDSVLCIPALAVREMIRTA